MTTVFSRPLKGFRFVQTHFGDTLQIIAARELKDATRWAELISLNNLIYPFITDDPAAAGDGVILTGASITIPASVPVVSDTTDAAAIFGQDVMLKNGKFVFDQGDLAIVAGRANLNQALTHLLETPKGALLMHLNYGTLVPQIIGNVNGPTSTLLAAEYSQQAIAADQRIDHVKSSTAQAVGDAIIVTVEAIPITGQPMSITQAF